MQNFNDLFVSEYHKGLFVKFHEFSGHIYYCFIPACENLVHLKVSAPKFSDLIDILVYSDHEMFYTPKEILLDCEYGQLDLGSNNHFLS